VATNRSPRRKRGPQKDRWRAGRRAFERATGRGRYLEGQLRLSFDVSPDIPPAAGVPSAAVDSISGNKEPSDG
jgi:hypothetical protein